MKSYEIEKMSKKLVEKGTKCKKITKYEDFFKTELAAKTKLNDEEKAYYKNLCEVANG